MSIAYWRAGMLERIFTVRTQTTKRWGLYSFGIIKKKDFELLLMNKNFNLKIWRRSLNPNRNKVKVPTLSKCFWNTGCKHMFSFENFFENHAKMEMQSVKAEEERILGSIFE